MKRLHVRHSIWKHRASAVAEGQTVRIVPEWGVWIESWTDDEPAMEQYDNRVKLRLKVDDEAVVVGKPEPSHDHNLALVEVVSAWPDKDDVLCAVRCGAINVGRQPVKVVKAKRSSAA